ncbi:MAG: L-seryl-tRNA(Sec) selenium transferase [Candidatus Brocadia sp. AMX2]|nr:MULTISPECIES: L-seryl-tRNA(Sec) selenium transferase [Brocadia]KXK33659.1 MAG: selenocysteine synthase [Candidatus Brocadia sinica]MBC6932294.1 L-seryl-tRNA(Sec) selenium transferase [Candidatus Brocadia sp.]MBL1169790.1 L-seryl-tRNA(Sec) selenium transferase [Candidatus Brocadia sp. AMX1]NOG40375.1 L-seryl-tRNA(Sec) selenium transferase [Planctomycetota bacterium]KAA0245087.1 MAG: L-seryl-tRNA(Sec) selenium transferase [Candidatus Brocadia sp. AMX2]
MQKDILRSIPSVNELLESPEISKLTGIYPRQLVVDAIRAVLEDIRQSLTNEKGMSRFDSNQKSLPCEGGVKKIVEAQAIDLSPQKLYHRVQQSLQQKFCGIEHAINATGIILHTGLGRTPLTDEAANQIQNILKSFCTLEIEKLTGRRGIRYHHIEQLVSMITGAESALVVNNNAAAVLLALDTLARGKEVIISRSQLVEIGGSFRMPDVMSKGGAILVEVGTTNKTYLDDYRNAITEHTGLILKVHQSNFKIVGFTETVVLKDLVSLGKERNIPVMYDLGSGALIDLEKFGLPHEPTVQESIKAGVDIVTFSTDKLMGGPQGGIIAGKKKWVDLLKKNPLTRALRVGKLTIAALEATLKLYLEEDLAIKKIPALTMIFAPLEAIEERCKRLISNVTPETKAFMSISTVDGLSEMGGGSLPGEGIPTKLISLYSEKIPAEELAARLRGNTPPIFARIEQGRVLLDMRTVYDDEVDTIVAALEKIFSQGKVN